MKNKRGFVLLETIVVLIVAVVSMLGLFLTYSFVFKNLNQGKYYDNINDVYKLNIFYKIMKEKGFPNDELLIINNDNCEEYFDNNCQDLNTNLNMNYFIYTNKNLNTILNTQNENLQNTDINYMNKLESNYSYLIGAYKINDDENYYYVSLKVGELQ